MTPSTVDRDDLDDRAWRRVDRLKANYAGLDGGALLAPLIHREFPGRIAVVSSFGAEAAVLLHLVAEIEPATPVVFLDTGKHFPETLAYREEVTARLGLRDLRIVTPDPLAAAHLDPLGILWRDGPDHCCHLRKVLPLKRALSGFDAWITGRKRYQGDARTGLETVEAADGRIRVNPLARWSSDRVEAAFAASDLPRHPMVEEGYRSIGCATCTRCTAPGEAARAGRWAGLGKSECGIHWPVGPSA